MSNRPEWMLNGFRQQVAAILEEHPHQDEAIEELALLLTRYALMPPETAKQQIQEADTDD